MPLRTFGSSLGEDWQEQRLITAENEPMSGDSLEEAGGAVCEKGAVGASVGTGTTAPIEAVGEWLRPDQPKEGDIVYGLRTATGQVYSAVTRVLVIISQFESAEEALKVAERIRTGLEETCLHQRAIRVNLPDGQHDAIWEAELLTLDGSGADEIFMLDPTVVTSEGRTINNPFTVGVARYGSTLITTSVIDARTGDERLEAAAVLDVVGAAK